MKQLVRFPTERTTLRIFSETLFCVLFLYSTNEPEEKFKLLLKEKMVCHVTNLQKWNPKRVCGPLSNTISYVSRSIIQSVSGEFFKLIILLSADGVNVIL